MADQIDTDVLRIPYRRRQFFSLFLLTLFLLAALRFIVLPWAFNKEIPEVYRMLDSILEELFVAATTGIVVTSVILLLTPAKELPHITPMKPGKELERQLANDLNGTNEYWYRGHTGKYMRSMILPKLAIEAKNGKQVIRASIFVLDPTNGPACTRLAQTDSRNDPSIKDTDLQVKNIRKQLFATILVAYALRKQYEPWLDVKIGLHQEFSLFRMDMTTNSVFITRSGKDELALRYGKESDFYRTFSADARLSFEGSKHLQLNVPAVTPANLNPDTAKTLITALGFTLSAMGLDKDLPDIVKIAKESKNPYAD
jgi:hypothetical protein